MNRQGLYYQPVSEIGTAVHVAVDGEYAGYILISDALRKDAKRTIRWLERHQLEAVMLTGDNERVAQSVAKQLGIEYVYANLMQMCIRDRSTTVIRSFPAEVVRASRFPV